MTSDFQDFGPAFAGHSPSSPSFSASNPSNSLDPESAALALASVNEDLIHECLDIVRSADELHLKDSRGGLLSLPQQVAVFSLRHCPDEEISELLEHARAACTADRSVENGAEAIDVPVQNEQAINHARGRYWCYTCTEPRPFKTCGAWKKHENEHEIIYKCKLGGLEQFSPAPLGSSAATNPSLCTTSCKRRIHMVRHVIKFHGVSTTDTAQKLAESSREVSSKRYWSCGFCVHLFASFKDRLDHLRDHFEHRVIWESWCLATEMKGLLCQTLVKGAWTPLLAASQSQEVSELFAPDSKAVRELRDRLQMGAADVEDAQRLAEEAIAACNSNQDLAGLHLGNSFPTDYGDRADETQSLQPTWSSDMLENDALFSDDTMGHDFVALSPGLLPFTNFSDTHNGL